MKTALITGASSGIGKELSYLFAQDQYNLILVARSEEALNAIAKECKTKFSVDVNVIVHDLSIPNSGVKLAEKVNSLGLKVDALVNNAGFGDHAIFASSDFKKGIDMLQLNVVNLTELSLIYSKEMLKRNDGEILNIASTAAFQPLPKMAIYAASKSYVLHLTEAIHFEMKNTNVRVTVLCPGATKTGFEKAADMDDSKLFDRAVMDAKTVAKAGYKGLKKNKMYVIPGGKNKVLSFLTDMTPFRKMKVWLAGKIVG